MFLRSDFRRRAFTSFCLALSLLPLAAKTVAAQSGANPTGLAFERASHFKRGINASLWFAQSTGRYTPERLTTYMTDDDFKLIHQLGFDHVRLSIDPAPLLAPPLTNGFNAQHLALLDGAVRDILANHLNVVLDIHPEGSYKHPLRDDPAAQAAFVQFWALFAAHFASTDPEHAIFEIMNEPEINDPAVWANIEGQVIPAIRRAAPSHTIVATANRYSGLHDLLAFQPLPDRNVIYTFHDYDPFFFTHQGATWTSDIVKPLSQIPYPSTPQNIAPKLSEEASLQDQLILDEYGLDQWNAARIADEIAFARKWGEQYHVPVWCGEFGVFRDHSNPEMRAAWIHDMRVALEANNIGWTMWDYRANFGLADNIDGKRVPDPLIVKALGLNP